MVRTRSESPRHAQHRCFCQQAPPGPAMEFPDLGAHCSEPSCQRLGEGRSAWGRGRAERGWELQVGRRVGSGAGSVRGGRGSKLGAVAKGAWLRDSGLGPGAVCCKPGGVFPSPEWKARVSGSDVEVPLDLQSDPLPADFLPLKCDACSGIFCADHVAYAQHHCGSAYQKVRGRSEGGRGRVEDACSVSGSPLPPISSPL